MIPRALAILTLFLASCSTCQNGICTPPDMALGSPPMTRLPVWNVAELEKIYPFDADDWPYECVKQKLREVTRRAVVLRDVTVEVSSGLRRMGIEKTSVPDLKAWQAKRWSLMSRFLSYRMCLQDFDSSRLDWGEFWEQSKRGKYTLAVALTPAEYGYFDTLNADEAWEYLQRKAWSADAELNSVFRDTGTLILAIAEETAEREIVQRPRSLWELRLHASRMQGKQGE